MAWEDRPYYREEGAGGFGMRAKMGFTPPTPVAMGIMVACFATFILQAATGDFRTGRGLSEWCALTFTDARAFTQPWRWITYQYLHFDAWHIFFNLIGIYFLVPPIERIWAYLVDSDLRYFDNRQFFFHILEECNYLIVNTTIFSSFSGKVQRIPLSTHLCSFLFSNFLASVLLDAAVRPNPASLKR